MALLDGQSEVDTVTMRVTGLGLELKTWERYSLREDFTTATAAFDFVFSTNDPSTYNQVFQEGAEIEITVNDRRQMTGIIERVRTAHSRERGLVYQISGRDFLGPVVSASIDPKIRISANQTVSDFLVAVLSQFGLSTIYIGDEKNYSVVTGYTKGKGKAQTQNFAIKEAKSRAVAADGKSAQVVYDTKNVVQVISRDRPDLKKIPLDQLKPKIGDGAMQVIERVLHRLGLRMWMAADGSGVIVDAPDFHTPPVHRLVRVFGGEGNNVIDGDREINAEIQPNCVLAVGQSTGSDMAKSKLKCIAVNELVAVRSDGSLVPSVQHIIARYPGIKILPLRPELFPADDRIVARRKPQPMFVKDDESKTIAQLEAFARRTLAVKQKEYLTAQYAVKGHTFEGTPWAMNTLVDVEDDYLGLHERLWTLERAFSKSRGEGTRTTLKLIKPFTFELGA